jgi:hypothetical protein
MSVLSSSSAALGWSAGTCEGGGRARGFGQGGSAHAVPPKAPHHVTGVVHAQERKAARRARLARNSAIRERPVDHRRCLEAGRAVPRKREGPRLVAQPVACLWGEGGEAVRGRAVGSLQNYLQMKSTSPA